jgi:hypothetical protein
VSVSLHLISLTRAVLRLVSHFSPGFLPDYRSLVAFALACETFHGAAKPLLIAVPFLTTTHAARTFAAAFARNVTVWKQARGKKAMLENKYWTPTEVSGRVQLSRRALSEDG